MSHTPGEWSVFSMMDNSLTVCGKGGSQIIAYVEPCGDRKPVPYPGQSEYDAPSDAPSDEEWANACLVAAAPDLLDAAGVAYEAILSFMNGNKPDFGQVLLGLARAMKRAGKEVS